MNALPYLFIGLLAFGLISVGRHLWRAFRTGEVSDEIWLGATNADDHYGFVVRVLGLLVLLGVLIWMCFEVISIFEVAKGT